MQSVKTSSLMKWLFGQLRPYKGKVAIAMTALLVSAGAWLLLGQGIKFAVDQGFIASNGDKLEQMVLSVLAIALIGSIATYFRFYWMIWLGERVSADIRQKVYAHLLTLSPAFFAKTRTGEVISRFTADTTLLQSVVGMGLSMALRSSVTFIGALVLMLFSSTILTLYVLIAVPIVLLPIRFFGARVRVFSKNSQDRVADVGAYVDETLHEIHTVQAYSHERIDEQSFAERIENVMSAAHQRIKYRALLVACIIAISVSAVTIVAWLGAQLVLTSELSAGELTAFMFYAVMAGGSVATISEVIGEVQKAAGASERLMELLNTQTSIQSPPNPQMISTEVKGNITLHNVSFAYPESPEIAVIKDLNLSINSGERIALVGPSGAGKSTLFQLLLRFYDVTSGDIKVEDKDIRTLKVENLREQFALVPQESVIFAASVRDNICYGRPNASQADIDRAAKAARAYDFIMDLPQGYDTNLGERGVRLSGGQKQRVAIARAILADRPILLLDEATSSLDAANEQHVKLALDELMKGKTTLIIAHRLATVINADKIVVMDKGQVVAIGSHQELLETNALYGEFAQLQLVN
ncbi:ABC transporter transmembrane domain-containing protein [Paraglaciecola aquimarina]|uniref:ABC transporter transmembrane domain-containing protein n=1 Tax=Paraglaciecola aquimarina TaxID=1235557 RepID=A0ABU3T0X1_9ALTE|nr:ABC transporter transmembrane domain-containing protein [Paraglaciecola aquimarina]MDU0355901.1 ABC transporter transmembrane domain-containing protein [Paraglaciecola aquimarina]